MARKPARKRAGGRAPAKRKRGSGARAFARKRTASRRKATAKRTGSRRKAVSGRASKSSSARKQSRLASRPAQRKAIARKGSRASAKGARSAHKRASKRQGGTGREATLAQTPETGRSVRGRTNPMPTRRSTGTPAGAGGTRQAPGLTRERKRLREIEETVPGPPSSLNLERHGSAARTGRAALKHARAEHTETSPALTGGDVDADWEDAYAVGDEAPGGDNPTPDQDRVDDIGKALGVTYQDNEELKAADKIIERDRHRWELDPASAEDFKDRDRD